METKALFYALVGGLLAVAIFGLWNAKDVFKPITGKRRAMIVFEEKGLDQNGELRMTIGLKGVSWEELATLDENLFTAPAMAKRVYTMFSKARNVQEDE